MQWKSSKIISVEGFCFLGGGNNCFAGWDVAWVCVNVLVDDSGVHDDWGVGVDVSVDNWGADVDVSPSTSRVSTPMGALETLVTSGPGVVVHGVGHGLVVDICPCFWDMCCAIRVGLGVPSHARLILPPPSIKWFHIWLLGFWEDLVRHKKSGLHARSVQRGGATK